MEGVHALGKGNGHLFEIDITTNRVDAMNHYGIAREAATIYNLPLTPLETALPAAAAGTKTFPVRFEAPERCRRFTARVLRGVKVAPSAGGSPKMHSYRKSRLFYGCLRARRMLGFL